MLEKLFGRNDLARTALHVFANEGPSILINEGIDVVSVVSFRVVRVSQEASISARAVGYFDFRILVYKLIPFIWADI